MALAEGGGRGGAWFACCVVLLLAVSIFQQWAFDLTCRAGAGEPVICHWRDVLWQLPSD